MKKILILLILLMFTFPAYAITIYKWADEKGVINFTDDYTKIPPAFRNRVKTEEYVQQEGTTAPAQATVATTTEQNRTDIYGRDDLVEGESPSVEGRVKRSPENDENAQKEYMEPAEGLGEFKFGRLSLTQYQMFSYGLEALNKEMETYRGQIAETNEMLGKLSQEAKETNADPAWLE